MWCARKRGGEGLGRRKKRGKRSEAAASSEDHKGRRRLTASFEQVEREAEEGFVDARRPRAP